MNKNIISDFIKMKGIQTETKIKSWSAVDIDFMNDNKDSSSSCVFAECVTVTLVITGFFIPDALHRSTKDSSSSAQALGDLTFLTSNDVSSVTLLSFMKSMSTADQLLIFVSV